MMPVPAIIRKEIQFGDSHVNESDGALKNFLKQSKKESGSLSIVSIQGNMDFNELLASSIPEHTELIHINYGLKEFMSKPRFDLIFYSLPENGFNQSVICENLCYCRMLLKQGGMLLFLRAHDRLDNLVQLFTWKKGLEARMLSRAGYTKISRLKLKKQRIFICGKRPENNY